MSMPSAPPRVVVDAQADLYERLAHPSLLLARYFDGFMSDTLERANVRGADEEEAQKELAAAYAYMFHPARDGAQFARHLSKQIFSARTYQATAEMVDATDATYQASSSNIDHITFHHVPAGEAGFVWLDRPVRLLDLHSKTVSHRVVSWDFQTLPYHGYAGDLEEPWPGVRITSWAGAHDQDSYSPHNLRDADELATDLGELIMGHSITVPFGQRFFTDQNGPGTGRDDIGRWLHTLWMFLEAEITVHTPTRPDRGSARRAQRVLGRVPDVQVITLRRASNVAEPTGEHREVDWSCSWLVQGFYRHLDHYDGPRHHAVPGVPIEGRSRCLPCQSRITWVRPHVRGPGDKPLRSVPQLYKLSR